MVNWFSRANGVGTAFVVLYFGVINIFWCAALKRHSGMNIGFKNVKLKGASKQSAGDCKL